MTGGGFYSNWCGASYGCDCSACSVHRYSETASESLDSPSYSESGSDAFDSPVDSLHLGGPRGGCGKRARPDEGGWEALLCRKCTLETVAEEDTSVVMSTGPEAVAEEDVEHVVAGVDMSSGDAYVAAVAEGKARQAELTVQRGAAASARELKQRERSLAEAAAVGVQDVLEPDEPHGVAFAPSEVWLEGLAMSVSRMRVTDSTGATVQWPWETGDTSALMGMIGETEGQMRAHSLDKRVYDGLLASTAKGDMGANTTGVRRFKAFCAKHGISHHRALDPSAPLVAKLQEEWVMMRWVSEMVEEVSPESAATYFGQTQGWHAREHGVKLAAGMKLNRLPAMLKGLRRIMGGKARKVRRGVSPQALRAAMDLLLDPNDVEHANIRAALSVALQGLLRGAEVGVEGRWASATGLARGDVVHLDLAKLVFMMRPCKNMRHLSGKTVPLIIGAGGEFIDAVAEMINLMRVDPVAPHLAAETPMFRSGAAGGERKALSVSVIRDWVKALMRAVGQDPAEFGAHSLRIGGATALFAAGADPIVIRTMGRWSSDCYRLYVRACFSQTVQWTARIGSEEVDDVAEEFDEVDCY